MAQYSSGNVPGPGTVVSGTALENYINELIDAFNSGSEGTTTPGNAEKGLIWSKSVTGGIEVYCHTGTTDVLMGTVNLSSNLFSVNESAISGILNSTGRGALPGQRGDFFMPSPPTGWLKANGAAVSRTTYAALFSAIGTTWGAGNGSTTFNLPDVRGDFIRAWDDGRGVDSGRAFASFQAHAFASHLHSAGTLDDTSEQLFAQFNVPRRAGNNPLLTDLNGPISQTASGLSAPTTSIGGVSDPVDRVTINWTHDHDITGNTGSTGGTETRPRNTALLVCIKF